MLKSKRLKLFISLILLNAINPSFSASGEFFVIRQDCHIQERLSPYTAVKFFNRVKFENRTAV